MKDIQDFYAVCLFALAIIGGGGWIIDAAGCSSPAPIPTPVITEHVDPAKEAPTETFSHKAGHVARRSAAEFTRGVVGLKSKQE